MNMEMQHIKIFGQPCNRYIHCCTIYSPTICSNPNLQAVNESGSPVGWVNGTLLDVDAFMNPWVEQTGYPVITATRDYDKETVTFKQNRFILPGNFSQNSDYQASRLIKIYLF